MYPRDIRVENPREALIVEQALAMYREARRVAANAPDGEVLHQAEALVVARGRELTRTSLESVLQEEIEAAEKKGPRRDVAAVAEPEPTAANKRARS